ncbi:hypothetical protein F0562_003836 [Nyssa sinensis]|uniref:Uncharacterized protein n=1 Tax=Nyssa sinensis TaxID=561372 RepID=A0A5J5BZH5_9ASTE|nr:hypothetical protein F0562_003836 [Nyssa sinensis]
MANGGADRGGFYREGLIAATCWCCGKILCAPLVAELDFEAEVPAAKSIRRVKIEQMGFSNPILRTEVNIKRIEEPAVTEGWKMAQLEGKTVSAIWREQCLDGAGEFYVAD